MDLRGVRIQHKYNGTLYMNQTSLIKSVLNVLGLKLAPKKMCSC